MTIFAGTGHRPPKLGGYGIIPILDDFAETVLANLSIDRIISGMALGWDQALAVAAHRLSIPFIAAIPFEGQESRWPNSAQWRYREIVSWASETVIVAPGGYSAHKMQLRNEWMCNHCDKVLAMWDGSSGGTNNCVQYAFNHDKPIINYYQDWLEFTRI